MAASMDVDNDNPDAPTLTSTAVEDASISDDSNSTRTVKFDDTVLGKRQFNVKITTDGTKSFTESLSHFVRIIAMIQDNYPEDVTIISNKGTRIKKQKRLTETNFESYFSVHQLQKKTGNKSSPKFIQIISLTLKTHLSLRTIKRNPPIARYLDKNRIFLRNHPWRHHQWDTISIGWLLRRHPTREQESDIKYRIDTALRRHSNVKEKEVPQYRLVPAVHRIKDQSTNSIYSTQSFEIHCLRKEKIALDEAFAIIFECKADYVRHSVRYTDPDLYKKLIIVQNEFLRNFRSIKVTGITHEMMFYLTEKFTVIPGATNLTTPWNQKIDGRWLINTDSKNFQEVGNHIRDNLQDWIEKLVPSDAFPSKDFQQSHPVQVHYNESNDSTSKVNIKDKNHTEDEDSTLATIRSYETTAKSYYSDIYKEIQATALPSEKETNPDNKDSPTPEEIIIRRSKTSPQNSDQPTWSSIVSGYSNHTESDITNSTTSSRQRHWNTKEDYITQHHTMTHQYMGYDPQPTNPAQIPLSTKERQEYDSLKAEVNELRNEMALLKTQTKSSNETTSTHASTNNPSTDIQFQQLIDQYQQMQNMFTQQQKMVEYFMQQIENNSIKQPSFTKNNSSTHNFDNSKIRQHPKTPETPIDSIQTYYKAVEKFHSPPITIMDTSRPVLTPPRNTILRKNLFPPPPREGKRTNPTNHSPEQTILSDSTDTSHKNKRHDAKSTPPQTKKPPDKNIITSSSISNSSKPISSTNAIPNTMTNTSIKKVPASTGQTNK